MKVLLGIALGFVLQLNAQIAQVVGVIASDPEAREIPPWLDIPENPAVFQVWRHGPTNGPLTVLLRIGGTASNGVDYEFISNSVTIPAGSFSTQIFVSVIDDQIVEGTETVVLTLQPSPCLSCYEVGSNSTAVAYILDDDATNNPPIAWISRPHEGDSFSAGTNILLRAVANDPEDGYDIAVEFFEGTNRIGAATFIPSLCPAIDCPSFDLIWSNVPPGAYTLTARATDKAGATTVSAPVNIKVAPSNTVPERTVVSVVASDSNAHEPGLATVIDAAQFAIRRAGNLAFSIPVSFTLGGTAVNGTDYMFISNRVVIPAGATQALVRVVPLHDDLIEGTETVVLTLQSPVCPAIFPPPPECYEVGTPAAAEVFIHDSIETNHPPFVQLNEPTDGSMFTALVDLVLRAYAQDAEDGNDLMVEFFAGTNRLGEGVFIPTLCPSPYCPYFALTWSNVPPGSYTLTAKATDKQGATTVSTPVHITVGPTTNLTPTVAIIVPTNGTVIPAGTDVHIEAVTKDPDGYADTVAFFADNHPIGEVTILFIQAPPPGSPINFEFTWTNPPPGGHVLTAATVDTLGARGTSAPVRIFVTEDTNRPPVDYTVVTVVALDSHAQEPGVGAVDTGQFAIRRGGNLSNDVTVFFGVGGSASNGSDYVAISNRVVIPAGETQAVVNIKPLADALVEGTETVVLELHPPVCAAVFPPPPGCYVVGSPGRATVFIADASAPTNRPPMVELVNPPDASIFPALADLLLIAHANDPDGYETVRSVEFFANSNSLGIRTNYPTANAIGPFFLIWSNVTVGEYALTARATDAAGASAVSRPVHVRVVDLTGTNRPSIWPWPRLRIPPQCLAEVRTNGCRLLLSAETPMTCVLESTVDLLHWTPFCTNTLSAGEIELRDCESSSAPMRFYRVRQE